MDNYRELKICCDPGFGHLPADQIQQNALGGIEEYTPIKNNRYCKIQLVPIIPSE